MATKPTNGTSDGEGWQEVRRRRRFPDHGRTPVDDRLNLVRHYVPYYKKRSYAQIVAEGSVASLELTGSDSSSLSGNSPKTVSPPATRPPTPPTPPGTQFFFSPHSPTKLRFPPLSSYPEWKGRCFNCCRYGHSAVKCRNPKKCGKCWTDGHIARQCKNPPINPAVRPTKGTVGVPRRPRTEPAFEELLRDSPLPQSQEFPEGRPKKVMCFMDRDESYFREVERLSRAVVFYGEKQGLLLEQHDVVQIAVDTGLVREQ